VRFALLFHVYCKNYAKSVRFPLLFHVYCKNSTSSLNEWFEMMTTEYAKMKTCSNIFCDAKPGAMGSCANWFRLKVKLKSMEEKSF